MKVRANVKMSGCSFDEWKTFFDSYEADRVRFVRNETVLQISDSEAEVVFEISDIEGLTGLSQRGDILDFEQQNGVVVSIEGAQLVEGKAVFGNGHPLQYLDNTAYFREKLFWLLLYTLPDCDCFDE